MSSGNSGFVYKHKNLVNAALHDELLLCYRKPHGPLTNGTLARWVKMRLQYSGINLDTFAAHSCRSASTSKAATAGVSLDRILMTGQWSNTSTFYSYYKKDILVTDRLLGPEFASGILSTTNN